ncbi:hypothetical protein I6N90_01680 [Paenibacillus sp. GSMTC-2017]|uniref:hypothetical protein n=1 Tax=Paenibacillus sp. GSMTC-2017 TaxID=2794350 RepID=UPI0018D955CC|nr:hypothetical protein [Paenibacillus sp. GSMTC-2017]MBH5316515.1 hypothetical protein [Paenibacillus sp. GSMTC-2017]
MDDLVTDNNGLYCLPLYQKPKLKLSLHILYGVIITMFLGFIMIPTDDKEKFILNIVFLVFALLFGFVWLAITFTKKHYLLITDEHLEYRWLFGHKVILLNSIYKVDFYSDNGVTKFGIWANEQGKRSFFERTDQFFGRDYPVSIVVSSFRSIDFEKLQLTLLSKVQH